MTLVAFEAQRRRLWPGPTSPSLSLPNTRLLRFKAPLYSCVSARSPHASRTPLPLSLTCPRAHDLQLQPPLPHSPTPRNLTMSTIAKTEAHAGSGDLGEGYKAPQNPAEPYQKGKENSHNLLDGKDERSHANSVRCLRTAASPESELRADAFASHLLLFHPRPSITLFHRTNRSLLRRASTRRARTRPSRRTRARTSRRRATTSRVGAQRSTPRCVPAVSLSMAAVLERC